MLGIKKRYFVTYAFERNNGSSGVGRAIIDLKHKIKCMDDILELEDAIMIKENSNNRNIKQIKINVINYRIM